MAKPKCTDGRRNNRPPVSGQFKPGQSGHRPGRPPGSRNQRTVLQDETNRTVTVTENGKRVRKKKWAIIIAQQVNKAVAGDLKAAQFVTEQMLKYGLLNQETDNEQPNLGPDEQAVFEELARRIRDSQLSGNPPDPISDENSPAAPPTPTGEDEKL
jgi:hypothetical protein